MTKSKPKPKPKPRRAGGEPLSRERILDAAFALVAEQGLAQLSTRKLGQRLACQAMSIYHHFPSKHHLLDAMVEHALSSVDIPEPGPDPEARLRRMLESYRAMARRFPALYPLVAVHRLNMPAGVRFIERVLRLIHDANGGDVELTARQFRAIGYYLTGAALDEAAGYARGPSAAQPVGDAYVAAHCPLLASVAPYFKPAHWDATWAYGLDALLDRAREDAAARAAPARRRARAAS